MWEFNDCPASIEGLNDTLNISVPPPPRLGRMEAGSADYESSKESNKTSDCILSDSFFGAISLLSVLNFHIGCRGLIYC